MDADKSNSVFLYRHSTFISDEDLYFVLHFLVKRAKQLCQNIKLTKIGTATACTYLQRFYSNNLFRLCTHDPYNVVVVIVYLASKVEECAVRLEDILSVLTFTTPPAPELLLLEMEILKALDFDLKITHPYRSVNLIIGIVEGPDEPAFGEDVAQVATSIINDSFFTDMCLRFKPHLIGIAAVKMACLTMDRSFDRLQRYLTHDEVAITCIIATIHLMYSKGRVCASDELSSQRMHSILDKMRKDSKSRREDSGSITQLIK